MTIIDSQRHLYRESHEAHPGRPQGLRWGSERAQLKRFEAACQVMDLKGLSVLDIGCGYGGLLPFCIGREVRSYHGLDIVPEIVKVAQERWDGVDDNVLFDVGNLLNLASLTEQVYDVVFAIGVAGLGDKVYLREVMNASYRLCKKAAVVTVATKFTPGPREGILVLHPKEFALMVSEVTVKFTLRHDYLPTDQMVYLLR